jgi:hypothetical protein
MLRNGYGVRMILKWIFENDLWNYGLRIPSGGIEEPC